MSFSNVRVPNAGDSVYKDECVYCFDDATSDDGLHISLRSFIACCKTHLAVNFAYVYMGARLLGVMYFVPRGRALADCSCAATPALTPRRRTGEQAYVRVIKRELAAAPAPAATEAAASGAVIVGAAPKQYDTTWDLVTMPEYAVHAVASAPSLVQDAVAAIIALDSASFKEDVFVLAAEDTYPSPNAESLVQLDNNVKIPPSGWACERCGLTENLWLNLSTGAILCGRGYFDGSGGNGHALAYYQDHPAYPLAVKLGTISAAGGDVYDYAENASVSDPHLARHLAHWGIHAAAMQKTEMTAQEIEFQRNKDFSFSDVISANGRKEELLFGPGYTGLRNIGSTCYLNSTLQMLLDLPDWQARYGDPAAAEAIFREAVDPANSFRVQLAKLARGMLSGSYSAPKSKPGTDAAGEAATTLGQDGVAPRMLKRIVGRGHAEFASARQQDAEEYFRHFMQFSERQEHAAGQAHKLAAEFRFAMETREMCTASGCVQYSRADETVLSLAVPVEAITNKAELDAYTAACEEARAAKKALPATTVRGIIPFAACIQASRAERVVPGFFSTAINARTTAIATSQPATYPRYLLVQMRKFTQAADWSPLKLDVSIDMPLRVSFEQLLGRGRGLLPGEAELPKPAGDAAAASGPAMDPAAISAIVGMGFSENAAKRAVVATGNRGAEEASAWLFGHLEDADINDPLPAPAAKQTGAGPPISQDAIDMVMALGIERKRAEKALRETGGDPDRAAEWAFSHFDEPLDDEPASAPAAPAALNDGPGEYELRAFISHMGPSATSGHYVVHIRRGERWVLFNDETVSVASEPRVDLAYLYLYVRV